MEKQTDIKEKLMVELLEWESQTQHLLSILKETHT